MLTLLLLQKKPIDDVTSNVLAQLEVLDHQNNGKALKFTTDNAETVFNRLLEKRKIIEPQLTFDVHFNDIDNAPVQQTIHYSLGLQKNPELLLVTDKSPDGSAKNGYHYETKIRQQVEAVAKIAQHYGAIEEHLSPVGNLAEKYFSLSPAESKMILDAAKNSGDFEEIILPLGKGQNSRIVLNKAQEIVFAQEFNSHHVSRTFVEVDALSGHLQKIPKELRNKLGDDTKNSVKS